MRNITIAFMLTVLSMTGCSKDSRPSDLPPLFPCEMTITQAENPLAGASVSLVSLDEANTKYQAPAVTDGNGRAVLVTYGFDGIPAGRYKVCVWKTVVEGVTQRTDKDGELVASLGTDYRTVERRYADAKTTPHEVEISGKGGATKASFDVGKAIKEKQ